MIDKYQQQELESLTKMNDAINHLVQIFNELEKNDFACDACHLTKDLIKKAEHIQRFKMEDAIHAAKEDVERVNAYHEGHVSVVKPFFDNYYTTMGL